MDISDALIAKSDQVNSIDLVSGPQTITVIDVTKGSAEQPVSIITDTFGPSRPFKPSKTVLRVLASAWGKETSEWVGRRATIYRDPSVRWAGEEVGGIRVSALSDIPKAITLNLPTSKGKHAKSTVTPLETVAPRDWASEIALAASDLSALEAIGKAAKQAGASEDVIGEIRAAYMNAKGGEA